MTRSIFFRLAAIGAISILLMIPLMQIHRLVGERQQARDAAVADIARGTGLAQTLTGPVLVVPAVKTLRRWRTDEKSGERRLQEIEERTSFYFLPERLALDATLATEQRRRGIYEARLYRTQAALEGYFALPVEFTSLQSGDTLRLEKAYVALGITDIRGIGTGLAATLNGTNAGFESGAAVAFLGGGVHASLPQGVEASPGARIEFAITVPLQGTGEFRITPMGRETLVRLRSSWPHPSFVGEFLPVSRKVDATGFDAQWQTSFFATNLLELTQACAQQAKCESLGAPLLGVSFIDPVDHYLKSERAIKYALLFIALTFAGFLLCEVLKGTPLHPVQYGLVGLSLALFFLLLVSLAEHIGFDLAYLAATTASVVLITYYLVFVLRSRALGLGFGASLALLYGLLYGILSAEDYALLMGALLLFAVLGAFMILTRRVDWSGSLARPH